MKKKKLMLGLFLIGIIMVIVGSVLHFYYGPVSWKAVFIGATMLFLGILLIVIVVVMSMLGLMRGGLRKIKSFK